MGWSAALVLLAATVGGDGDASGWTPHSAAAVLDATYDSESACRDALDHARVSAAVDGGAVHGLAYARLFAQARCVAATDPGVSGWQVRMVWSAPYAKSR